MLIVIVSFFLSSVFTSDAVSLIVVSLVLGFSRKIGVSRSRAVILVVAGNIGSLISPQMIPGILSYGNTMMCRYNCSYRP